MHDTNMYEKQIHDTDPDPDTCMYAWCIHIYDAADFLQIDQRTRRF